MLTQMGANTAEVRFEPILQAIRIQVPKGVWGLEIRVQGWVFRVRCLGWMAELPGLFGEQVYGVGQAFIHPQYGAGHYTGTCRVRGTE